MVEQSTHSVTFAPCNIFFIRSVNCELFDLNVDIILKEGLSMWAPKCCWFDVIFDNFQMWEMGTWRLYLDCSSVFRNTNKLRSRQFQQQQQHTNTRRVTTTSTWVDLSKHPPGNYIMSSIIVRTCLSPYAKRGQRSCNLNESACRPTL